MANIPLKTVKFLGLPDTYTIPQIDDTLSQSGKAADAKEVGDQLGEITEDISDLKDDLNELEDNTVIITDTEKSGFHDVSPVSVSFYPDVRLTAVTAKYAGSKNLISTDKYNKGLVAGITGTIVGNIMNLVGTGTNQRVIFNDNSQDFLETVRGKTVNVYTFIKKSTPWELSSWFGLYDGKKYKVRKYFTSGGTESIGWTAFENITIAQDATILLFKFDSLKDAQFTEGDCIWIGIYETALIDTENYVTGETPYTINVEGLNCIDTATHESTAKYVENTKRYVDGHIPDILGFWSDNVYALPEKFGAIGNGLIDDSEKIADCLTYAKQTGKAVRGYGKYKITSPIVLDEPNMDVYFKDIVYTGNQYAVDVANYNIHFEFSSITSDSVGLRFGYKPETTIKYARRCRVYGTRIESNGDCIFLERRTYYNTCEIRYLKSQNGNCITTPVTGETHDAGEYVFRSSACACPNGYVAANVGSSKFYDFTIEGNCKYGFLNPAANVYVGVRHREQVDTIYRRIFNDETSLQNGSLFVFSKSPITDGAYAPITYIASDALPWYAIDGSAIQGFDPIDMSAEGPLTVWQGFGFSGKFIGCSIRGIHNTKLVVIGKDACFIGNNLVCTPPARKTITLTELTCDFRLLDLRTDAGIRQANDVIPFLGTDYITGISHSDVYFNAWFGAVGYNDLTVTQEDGYTVTIYDKLGNTLFDGTNMGDGKWGFKCAINPKSFGRYGGTTDWWCYDGTNETWTIEKIG